MINKLSNFELLRIISMIFIIIHHLTLSALGLSNIKTMAIIDDETNYFICSIINNICIIGVNCFFLLSGYFKIKLNIKKLFRIIIELYFYSTAIRLLGVFIGTTNFNSNIIKEIIMPFNIYWFISVYILIMLISPLLNIIIDNINKKTYTRFLWGVLLICGVVCWLDNSGLVGINDGYSFIHGMYMYMIGAGLKNFSYNNNYIRKYIIVLLINIILSFVGIFILKSSIFTWKLYSYNSALNVLESIYFFLIFRDIIFNGKIKSFILWVSPNILPVYYLHSSSWIGKYRNLPIENISQNTEVYIYMIVYAIVIFFICIFIDKVKRFLLDEYINKFIDKIINIFKNFYNNYLDIYLNKL